MPSNVRNCLSKSEKVSDKSVRANEAKGQKCTRKFKFWRGGGGGEMISKIVIRRGEH